MLGPGQWAAWVDEHGAHLLDYAAHHLGPDRAARAAAAAFAACGTRAAPGGVSVRAWLLAVLRRECFTRPGHRDGYVPGTGPGMPAAPLLERAWTLAGPLGTETLRLMFRHELTSDDLAHVLALPREEVDRLATRTQDVVETLVSALDGLAHGRASCPALRPLAEAPFPGGPEAAAGPGRDPGGAGTAGEALLAHVTRCATCARPINIRYTVPQMSSHPPVAPLTAQVRALLLDALPPAAGRSPEAGVPAAGRPSDTAPGTTGRPAEAGAPATVALPVPRRGTAPYAAPAGGQVRAPSRRPPSGPPPSGAVLPGALVPGTAPPGPPPGAAPEPPTRAAPRPAGARPYPPPVRRAGAVPPPAQVRPSEPAPASGPGQDTPLYDALLSQVMSRTGPTLDVPRTIPAADRPGGAGRAPGDPHDGPRIRLSEALRWAGVRVRSTTLKIVVIVAAGTAGTLTGMNLLGPATGSGPVTGSIPSARPQAATAVPSVSGPPGSAAFPSAGDTRDTAGDALASRVFLPAEVTLDAYGRGELTLTGTSQEPLTWRVSAPGLVVNPSSGTLEQGDTRVLTLRALRVRHWCGPAPLVSVPLTVHGPDEASISTTVRWRTC
ncbi:hypothetical protein GCM10010466_24380 [Planomonospora alba]|uniref:Uncharacterized protein n=1 Tax=Planomonospora alba TaxID=161354 RepID=A0ABP6N171_9ACTN